MVGRELLAGLLDLLYPGTASCVGCGRDLRHIRGSLCSACLGSLTYVEGQRCPRCGRLGPPCGPGTTCAGAHAYAGVYGAAPYVGLTRAAIIAFKYGGDLSLSAPLGRMLQTALARAGLAGLEVIVPVPLHPQRQRGRGFNQAELLGRQVSAATGLPLRRALCRVGHTEPQAGMGRSARLANVGKAFAVARAQVTGRTVLLVDDVYTTGATADACAKTLLAAGARSVHTLVVAVAPRQTTLDDLILLSLRGHPTGWDPRTGYPQAETHK